MGRTLAQHRAPDIDNNQAILKSTTMKTILLIIALLVTPLADARIKRSQSAKVEFKLTHPCPYDGSTKGPCFGWVIDHKIALACGGPDIPENMQYQTIADGKAKDKIERIGCKG